MDKAGNFIISLDFELFWGVSENKTIKNYGLNISNTHDVVNKLLNLFSKYNIEATWATVGFLFFKEMKSLNDFICKNKIKKINYENKSLNNFNLIEKLNDFDKKHLFAINLINKIKQCDGQEIASHTFSHLYSLEKGVNHSDIKSDFEIMFSLFSKFDLELDSVVFPRNQYSKEILEIVNLTGIKTFRGNQNSYLYRPSLNQNLLKRLIRLIDSYINISGYNPSILKKENEILNIPASRFLRPYSNRLRIFEKIRLNRIKKEMTKAAKTGSNYHLWWHPHNFGAETTKNLLFLEKILVHQNNLNDLYGFKSQNMNNVSNDYF